MILTTSASEVKRLFSKNSVVSGAITSLQPTLNQPAGDGVWSPRSSDGSFASYGSFIFFGTRSAADNETSIARITGWSKLPDGLWLPKVLADLSLTQGAMVGNDQADEESNEYFVDTISGTIYSGSGSIASPSNDQIARVNLDLEASSLVQVQLARTTNAAGNCLAFGF